MDKLCSELEYLLHERFAHVACEINEAEVVVALHHEHHLDDELSAFAYVELPSVVFGTHLVAGRVALCQPGGQIV